jgi:multiple sugar transport system substrate-binding protein
MAVLMGATAATFTLLLSGCTGSSGGSDKVQLSYAIWDQAQKAATQKIINEFEKENPNVTVKVQVTPWDTYFTKLRTAVSSGTAPDLFWLGKTDFPTYANGGALLPIDDRVKKDKVDLDAFVDSGVKGAKWDGKLLGLPKDVDTYGLWYNRSLFEAAGVATPTDSWTQKDLIDAAIALTNPEAGIYGMISAPPSDQIWFSTILQEGGHIISDDRKSSGVDTPEGIKGIQFWVDLVQKYKVSPNLKQLSDTDAEALFQSGKAAMMYGGSWVVSNFKNNQYVLDNASVAPMAKIKVPGATAGGITNVISAKTKHQDEAWSFLKYLGSKEAAIAQAEGGIIPAYKSAQSDWVASNPETLNTQVFIDTLAFATPLPSTVDVQSWSTVATEQLTKAWEGQTDVPTAAAAIAAAIDKALAKNPESGS